MRALRRAALAPLVAGVLLLGACSGDDGSLPSGAPSAAADEELSLDEGDAFGFAGMSVAEGWEIVPEDRDIAGEPETLVGARGEVTNDGDEAAFPLFEILLIAQDRQVAATRCSGDELAPDASGTFTCTATEVMPADYDRVVVRAVTR